MPEIVTLNFNVRTSILLVFECCWVHARADSFLRETVDALFCVLGARQGFFVSLLLKRTFSAGTATMELRVGRGRLEVHHYGVRCSGSSMLWPSSSPSQLRAGLVGSRSSLLLQLAPPFPSSQPICSSSLPAMFKSQFSQPNIASEHFTKENEAPWEAYIYPLSY